jgi:hypothetical protein
MSVIVATGARVTGLGPLEVSDGKHRWIVGTGEKIPGDNETWRATVNEDAPPPPTEAEPIGAVVTETFELFRAITGRRSAGQIRSLDWSLDPTPFLPLFGYGPFIVRNTDLQE